MAEKKELRLLPEKNNNGGITTNQLGKIYTAKTNKFDKVVLDSDDAGYAVELSGVSDADAEDLLSRLYGAMKKLFSYDNGPFEGYSSHSGSTALTSIVTDKSVYVQNRGDSLCFAIAKNSAGKLGFKLLNEPCMDFFQPQSQSELYFSKSKRGPVRDPVIDNGVVIKHSSDGLAETLGCTKDKMQIMVMSDGVLPGEYSDECMQKILDVTDRDGKLIFDINNPAESLVKASRAYHEDIKQQYVDDITVLSISCKVPGMIAVFDGASSGRGRESSGIATGLMETTSKLATETVSKGTVTRNWVKSLNCISDAFNPAKTFRSIVSHTRGTNSSTERL